MKKSESIREDSREIQKRRQKDGTGHGGKVAGMRKFQMKNDDNELENIVGENSDKSELSESNNNEIENAVCAGDKSSEAEITEQDSEDKTQSQNTIIKGNRNIILSVSITVIILAGIVLVGMMVRGFINADDDYYMKCVKKNIDAFDNVAKYGAELKTELAASQVVIRIAYHSGESEMIVEWYDYQNVLHSYDEDLSQDIKDDIGVIKDVWRDLEWNGMRVLSDQVTFSAGGNNYAAVYSISGHRPTYMNSADEYFDVKVKSIGKKWYFMTAR